MSTRIGSNIASLRAQRRLAENSSRLETIFERLASGQRINHARDDAAGLAIASGLNADSRVYGQGLRNINDGLSALQVAEGALNELSSITIRLQELAEQAANGTYSATQRGALNQEAEALMDEYNRIIESTEFNGSKLLDGSTPTMRIQAGYGVEGGIEIQLSEAFGQAQGLGTFGAGTGFVATGSLDKEVTIADMNNDGTSDLVMNIGSRVGVLLGNGDGTFQSIKLSSSVGASTYGIAVQDVNHDGLLDAVTTNPDLFVFTGKGDGTFNAPSSYELLGVDTFLNLVDVNSDGNFDFISDWYGGTGVEVLLGNSNGTFSTSVSYDTTNAVESSLGDFNEDGKLDIAVVPSGTDANVRILYGDGVGGFTLGVPVNTGTTWRCAFTTADIDGDGKDDLIEGSYGSYWRVSLGYGDGTFHGTAVGYFAGDPEELVAADLNDDGIKDLAVLNDSGRIYTYFGNGDGTFKASQTIDAPGFNGYVKMAVGDLNEDGVNDIVQTNGESDGILVFLQDTVTACTIDDIDLSTAENARNALTTLETILDGITQQLGTIGSSESRLAVASATLSAVRQNTIEAASRITDADVAVESANLIRSQLLQQAGAAVLAQANQQPLLALQLLGGS